MAVAKKPTKGALFNMNQRLDFVKKSVKNLKGVNVESFDGLVVEYVKSKKANVIIRGLRMISDFEYEFQMALTNRKLEDSVETIFMMPNESYSYVSSKLIKEAASMGADLNNFVPNFVCEALRKRFLSKR